MRDESIAGFLNELGAKQPTPGGGAVSALNGAIAAAQLKMVCEYTKDSTISSEGKLLAQKSDAFLDLADADVKAFIKVSEAYRSNDAGQINASLMDAMGPSINVVDICKELVGFCEENYRKLNVKLTADLIVVLANLKASVRSAKAMIRTNMESLGENSPDSAKTYISQCDELLYKIDDLYKKLGA